MAPGRGDRGKGPQGPAATTARSRSITTTPAPTSRPRRPPRTSGPHVTDRDLEILRWVGRHGIVTREQVANRFFSRDNGNAPGVWAAYRRVRILIGLGLLQQDNYFWREPAVLRVTTQGARMAGIDVRPARLILAEIRHSLAVVDLLEQVLARMPKNTVLITEREIRASRRRDLRLDPTKIGTGRMPDAELQRGGKRIAVELDLTPKRSRVYEDILTSYLRQRYDEVWWYVSPRVAHRLKKIVRDNRADDFVTVRPWEG